jgi:hypothetical protein
MPPTPTQWLERFFTADELKKQRAKMEADNKAHMEDADANYCGGLAASN